ncbi:MAG TPA: DUF2283 domain-containing protein [Rubrivivax sp.]|nr:DUF2283 domain-containing protein [Rubrivivax sp.]
MSAPGRSEALIPERAARRVVELAAQARQARRARIMRVQFDPSADAMSIRLASGEVAGSDELREGAALMATRMAVRSASSCRTQPAQLRPA